MTHRILPPRFGQEIAELVHDGFSFRVGTSRHADGSPADVRIDSAKPGSKLDAWGHDVSALLSLLMRSGVDLSTIEKALDHSADSGLAVRVVRIITAEAHS